MISCNACNELLDEESVLSHVQEIHHGPPPYEVVKVACAHCSYKVSKEKLPLMLEHCRLTNHAAGDVELEEWEDFMSTEKRRTRAILREALDLLLKDRDTDEELTTPNVRVSKRSFVSEEEPARKKHRIAKSITFQSPIVKVEEEEAEEGDEEENPDTTEETENTKPSRPGECSVCEKRIRKSDSVESYINHVFKHDSSIRRYKCSVCELRFPRKQAGQIHQEKRECGGTLLRSLSPEDQEVVRDSLETHFPFTDWALVCANGIPGYTPELSSKKEEEVVKEDTTMSSASETTDQHSDNGAERRQAPPNEDDDDGDDDDDDEEAEEARALNKIAAAARRITKEKSFVCQICATSLNAPQNNVLTKHVLIHNNLKPFKCNHCEYRSYTKQTIRAHCKGNPCETFSIDFPEDVQENFAGNLERAFPTVNWEQRLQKGIPGITL